MDRFIGEYEGTERGPLVICIAGVHGNEHAGIKALDLVLKMLEVEPITNPGFVFFGKLIALRGNLLALSQAKRYIDKDLNRNFISDRINSLLSGQLIPEYHEDKEAIDLIQCVLTEIQKYNAKEVVFIDLHTTSSPGGIFTIVPKEAESLEIAKQMHAPVIQGIIDGVKGTTMHYFTTENLGVPTKTITFESGQHDDPMSIKIAIAGVIASLRALKCVNAQDVENLHDEILINYSKDLPSITKLIMKHSIKEGDNFKMKANYLNFQKVYKDEIVASDKNGPIKIQEDGVLLMPLYQSQGEDGFFLIKPINDYEFHI